MSNEELLNYALEAYVPGTIFVPTHLSGSEKKHLYLCEVKVEYTINFYREKLILFDEQREPINSYPGHFITPIIWSEVYGWAGIVRHGLYKELTKARKIIYDK